MCDSCEFKMPYGQFKGELLSVLRVAERSYLEWICTTFEDGEIRDAASEVLESHEAL